MTTENVTQAPKQVLKDVSTLEYVISAVHEREEQLYAMASSLLMHLTPKDENNVPDGHPITAWRLAQVLDEILSSTSHTSLLRTMLMPPPVPAKS